MVTDMKCINCFYFYENDFSSGTCKRFPPVLDVHWKKDSRDDEYMFSEDNPECWGQPNVLDDNWCGEYKKDGN